MSDHLVQAKIKEALVAAGQNRHDAHKLLMTWAVRDPALLLSMTKPHLKAIASGLVDHYVRHQGSGEGDGGGDAISRAAIEDIVAETKLRTPYEKRKTNTVPPPKSTERQATAMRKLAAAFTHKKKSQQGDL